MPDARHAATVVLLRDSAAGLETLLLRRNSQIAFGGMWVFPGGRVDDGDRAGLAPDDGLGAARRAAIREAQEEAGLIVPEGLLVPLSQRDDLEPIFSFDQSDIWPGVDAQPLPGRRRRIDRWQATQLRTQQQARGSQHERTEACPTFIEARTVIERRRTMPPSSSTAPDRPDPIRTVTVSSPGTWPWVPSSNGKI